jgi:prepilin-type processing-associated H-X9-DG protein
VQITRLSRPSHFPVLATSQRDDTVKGGLRLTSGGPSPKAADFGYAGATEDTGPAPTYGRRAVFLFADWHVQARDVCDANAWPWNDPDGNAFKVQ